jgi:hypothetical protein
MSADERTRVRVNVVRCFLLTDKLIFVIVLSLRRDTMMVGVHFLGGKPLD